MTLGWDPPALALVVVGGAALLAWLFLSPPRREAPVSAGLQIAAALLLGLALVNAGWRSAGGGARPTLVVLVDRSASMEVAAPGDDTRRAEADAWLAGEAFERWSAGWRVEIDSFGGATSDPVAAIEAAAAGLPGAILVVGDGRATGGRVASAPEVPLFVHAPAPLTVTDAAVLDLTIEEEEEAVAAVEIAAVGGEATPERTLAIRLDGRVVARSRAPALTAGERRTVRVGLPDPGSGERVVEARLEDPGDPVAGNDARAIVWRPREAVRTLLVGLDPGWELGVLRRALESGDGGPIDAFWSGREATLRRVDGGAAASWAGLDPGRYESFWLVGDPALLGAPGRAWVGRFAAGGRGLYWAAGPAGGELAGVRAPAAGDAPSAAPQLTGAGRDWLASLGGDPAIVPDGSRAWPPLEGLPAAAVDLAAGARVLVRAGATPVAWSLERGGFRAVVTLGTGWYRIPLEGGEAGRAFWRAWTEGARRWLGGAGPLERPLVTLPPGGRIAAGEPLAAPLAEGAGAARWRVTAADGGAEIATGVAEAGVVEVDSLPAGAWRLAVTADGRTETRALAVEPWTPDLARTESDTLSLAAAARASGGGRAVSAALPAAAATASSGGGPVVGLGLVPWAFLGAALLVLAHWAAAGRSR